MNYGILDVETSIKNKGHPFTTSNSLCLVGLRINGINYRWTIDYGLEPYRKSLEEIQKILDTLDRVVGFNLKFDLSWLNRYGIFLAPHTQVYDLQLVRYILSYQKHTLPSLDDTLAVYQLGEKLHVIEEEYWSKGIDTPDIPLDLLVDYLNTDLEVEDRLYQHYQTMVPEAMKSLIALHNHDLLVLQEMEYNGIKTDWTAIEAKAVELEKELVAIYQKILSYVPEACRSMFNLESGEHLSCLLYGGTLKINVARPYEHTYKSGKKSGLTEIRNKWEEIVLTFPRLVEPLPKTSLKKEGFWSTDVSILKELKGQKELLSSLLRYSAVSKLVQTYLRGWQKQAAKWEWLDGYVHGKFNQCIAITGRLSSSDPNLQNNPEEMNEFITTRF